MNDKQIIKRLTQELEEATKPKWISVDEEMPNKRFEWYLISSDCNKPHESLVTMAFLDSDINGRAIWLVHNDGDRACGSDEWENVTHWMSLPERPQQ